MTVQKLVFLLSSDVALCLCVYTDTEQRAHTDTETSFSFCVYICVFVRHRRQLGQSGTAQQGAGHVCISEFDSVSYISVLLTRSLCTSQTLVSALQRAIFM